MSADMTYILGIDTGGTYTDGVIVDTITRKVISKSKTPTTKYDLKIGIENCIKQLDIVDGSLIRQVSLSTTLATNAVVENNRCKTGLILIGRESKEKVPTSYVEYVTGRMDINGNEIEPISNKQLQSAISHLKDEVDAIAISGYASVRNPVNEIKAKKLVEDMTNLPVFCAHELSGSLGFAERTNTAVLNAGLIKIVEEFLVAAKEALLRNNIMGQVMIVRSDGCLMREEHALQRPIETILSGPAASIMGACVLTDIEDAFILDMGGTTMDIANLKNGSVNISNETAKIGGWSTRVNAVEVSTHGIGGDSHIQVSKTGITIGPQKAKPISQGGVSVDLTPTDILRILERYDVGNREAVEICLSDISKNTGINYEILIGQIMESINKTIYTGLIQSVVDFNNKEIILKEEKAASYLIDKAYTNDDSEFLSARAELKKPIIAVGAPVKAWLPHIGSLFGAKVIIPDNAEVANAIGAAFGRICEKSTALIRRDKNKRKYYLHLPDRKKIFYSRKQAKAYAKADLEKRVTKMAEATGCSHVDIDVTIDDLYVETLDNRKKYIETKVTAIASGWPTLTISAFYDKVNR